MCERKLPYIIVHMLSTVDGKLLCERYSVPHGMKDLNPIYENYYKISEEFGGEAIVMGRTSVVNYCSRLWDADKYKKAEKFEPFIGKRESKRLQIILDRRGLTYYDNAKIRDRNIVAVLGEQVSEDYLSFLREMGISYCFAGEDGSDLKKAFETLYTLFGMKKIVVQGGGEINGSFLKLGMIDEISITLLPSIDGLAGIPTIFQYKGKDNELPAEGQHLELISANVLDHGVVHLRYNLHKKE